MAKILWQTPRRTLDLTESGVIMGILNVTPDSFSDGGDFGDPDHATEHALQMTRDGAAIIDVGGESTRPGAQPVDADEELHRVVPVIERIRRQSDVLISVDTWKASVAHAAMKAGADIINDITGLAGDPEMPRIACETNAAVVLMHMQGTPRTMQERPHYDEVVTEVREFLRQRMEAAVACGIDAMRIALDPGIGFGKTPEHNLTLLRESASFGLDGRPVLIGVSRKSFLNRFAETREITDRFWPGVALTSVCRHLGARVFRVHDPKPHSDALRMTEAILNPEA